MSPRLHGEPRPYRQLLRDPNSLPPDVSEAHRMFRHLKHQTQQAHGAFEQSPSNRYAIAIHCPDLGELFACPTGWFARRPLGVSTVFGSTDVVQFWPLDVRSAEEGQRDELYCPCCDVRDNRIGTGPVG